MKKMRTMQDFAPLLREHGFCATPARLAILQTLARTKKPLTVEGILARQGGHAPNLATVYRAAKELNRVGVLKQIDLGHNHAHYELAGFREHHHLICLQCGRIEDVERCDVKATQNAILRNSKNFAEIRRHALEFYGVCKPCVSKKEKIRNSKSIGNLKKAADARVNAAAR